MLFFFLSTCFFLMCYLDWMKDFNSNIIWYIVIYWNEKPGKCLWSHFECILFSFCDPASTVAFCLWKQENVNFFKSPEDVPWCVWVCLSTVKRDIELFTLLVALEAAIWRHHGWPLETQITQQLRANVSHNYTVSIFRAKLCKRHILHGAQPAERRG